MSANSKEKSMRGRLVRALLFAALFALFLLHNDIWFWHDSQRVAKLPVGLTYHVAFCIAASILMASLAFFAWPRGLDSDEAGEGR